MDKRLTFNYILDVDGDTRRYPKDPGLVALFMVIDEDINAQYFVYAACTKRNFSEPDLIEVTDDVYQEVKSFFKTNFNYELADTLCGSIEDVHILIYTASDTAETESQTIGEMLGLSSDNLN